MRILILCLLVSCGVNVNVKQKTPIKAEPITFGPDFEGAAAFCDERYGDNTEEAEACFIDYREYFKINLGIDTKSIEKFCNDSYTTEEAREQCITDLTDAISNIGGNNEQV